METTYLIVVVISLIFSAFFSGIEIAFISSDKLQIELSNKQQEISGRIMSAFIKKPSLFISTTLIGNNIALVVYGIFMAFLLEPLIVAWLPGFLASDITVFLVQTVLSTFIVLVTAEFLPKSTFLIDPNKVLSFLAVPIYIIHILLYPAVWLIVVLSRFMIEKVFRFQYSEDQPVFGLTDLNDYVKRMMQQTEKSEKQEVDTKIFSNALEFKTIKIRDCLVPRTELVTVDIDDTIEDLQEAFAESGFSKILVYRDSIDDIVGYCNSIELFKKPKKIADIVSPILIVPETMLANELLIQLITERKSIALVVDEFGGTSGIVTIEDIIEEIFGDIQDEHDEEDLLEEMIDNKNYVLSARHEIDYLNEKYRWKLPSGDYDTLGGLILATIEDIPEVNEIIKLPPFIFTILSLEDNRIDKVRLTIESVDGAGNR
jgi:CBS domain containing-hemolysin-like protein